MNARDARGRTALHGAAFQGYDRLVAFPATHGADLTAADADGLTPMDAALGKLRGRGGAPEPREGTAQLLAELIAAAARAPPGAD